MNTRTHPCLSHLHNLRATRFPPTLANRLLLFQACSNLFSQEKNSVGAMSVYIVASLDCKNIVFVLLKMHLPHLTALKKKKQKKKKKTNSSRFCKHCKAKAHLDPSVSVCGARFFCDECKRPSKLDGSYMLPMVLARGAESVNCIAYDSVVSNLIGCSAFDFDQLRFEFPYVTGALEQSLRNQMCKVGLGNEREQLVLRRTGLCPPWKSSEAPFCPSPTSQR
ncbi:hypothetical protein DFJ73DRAFT_55827 [Zopfochytrium polystomum]|nr:hypothetical protein DFJ73DRAFT_55827 [Zopfochytrium polystomum]